jgi:hypothetical protein
MASTTISSSLQATTFRIHLHLWMLVTHSIVHELDLDDWKGQRLRASI